MNEQWRVKQTCTSLGASQVSGACRALAITFDKVAADKGVAKDERAFVTRLLGASRARMERAVDALDAAVAAQASEGGAAQPSGAAALAAYRTPWRTLRDGLRVGARMEKEAGQTGAAELSAAVFGAGNAIPFLAGSPFAAWTDAGKAIAALRGGDAVAVLTRHHLTEQLARVEAAHLAFGRAIGATGSLQPRPAVERVSVRDTLAACTEALCDYVTRACAVEDEALPGSDALLSRLLGPLESVPRVHDRPAKAAAAEEGDGEEGDGEEDADEEDARDDGTAENDDADAEPEAPRKVG